ncbi:competence protein ComFC [Bacillus tianshenii]|uniref:Competence protein ComFC n=1 Tax=Sutcliffiella tianshenii TaxID=1463404 RepID=A0ABS2NVC6_9BACI|nr:ComF family protein [Bacillus tianshenii]MBM7618373.1 competence protein ComFC [Bacillus tianshenii]
MSKCLICQESIAAHFGWTEFLGLGKEKLICTECDARFEKIGGALCDWCVREWKDGVCPDCKRWENTKYKGVLKYNRSVYHYNSFMKEVLALYKFRGDAVLAKLFKDELKKIYKTHFQDLLVVPIPLSEERLYERGFNQSLFLAQQLDVEIVEALTKSEAGKQSKKGRLDRMSGENHFYVALPEAIENKDIVLIDDIYTTGTTIRMASKRLKDAGAKEISSLTLVRS